MTHNRTRFTLLAAILAGVAIISMARGAHAQEAAGAVEPQPSFSRFRVAAGLESVQSHHDITSLSVSYDFARLSRVPGGSRDPAAVSFYVDSTGDNVLHESYGSQLFAGVTVRTPARPVYVLLALGVSHGADSGDYSETFLEPGLIFNGPYEYTQEISRPATQVGARLLLGFDVPRTPVFLEVGLHGDASLYESGTSFRLGVRL